MNKRMSPQRRNHFPVSFAKFNQFRTASRFVFWVFIKNYDIFKCNIILDIAVLMAYWLGHWTPSL